MLQLQEISAKTVLCQTHEAVCVSKLTCSYLSMKLVVMKTILASDEATPSRELSSPLKVSLPIPWKARGSDGK